MTNKRLLEEKPLKNVKRLKYCLFEKSEPLTLQKTIRDRLSERVEHVGPLGRVEESRAGPTVSLERFTVTSQDEIAILCLRKFHLETFSPT
ncbi:hypothetical protein EVAR_57784_1 [Eumeta japonica]|uniref:Uncharacterized protein n=1 Tax=Eumeta variegata TaxID=151549 RepID=A0A4C1Y538_EUMVA|nr:hypothetical protein EVAR_57784_1 [Eumeta japonica]